MTCRPAIRSLLIIGHNPGIGDLVRPVTRDGSDAALAAQAAQFLHGQFRRDLGRRPSMQDFGQGCRLERLFTVDAGVLPLAELTVPAASLARWAAALFNPGCAA